MKSCLYEGHVMHARLEPFENRFVYPLFMFYLDLDQSRQVAQDHWFTGHNRLNVFSFWDKDHLGAGPGTVREKVQHILSEHGMAERVKKVMLLSHWRTLGHVFNPVSFYFCLDAQGQSVCAIVEVENTYREKKNYVLAPETLSGGHFRCRVPKYFYVSPFIALDASFDFNLTPPQEDLKLFIDDYQDGCKLFVSSLTARRFQLSNARLLWYALRFPLITLQVLTLIHWQALKLWLKRLPHIPKSDRPDLQREVIHARNT